MEQDKGQGYDDTILWVAASTGWADALKDCACLAVREVLGWCSQSIFLQFTLFTSAWGCESGGWMWKWSLLELVELYSVRRGRLVWWPSVRTAPHSPASDWPVTASWTTANLGNNIRSASAILCPVDFLGKNILTHKNVAMAVFLIYSKLALFQSWFLYCPIKNGPISAVTNEQAVEWGPRFAPFVHVLLLVKLDHQAA